MSDNKISIKSMVSATVGVNLREVNRRFQWPRKGAVVKVDKDVFDVMMYDIGFNNMLKHGVLFITDMDVKKEMGLEPEDAVAPVNLIELSDEYIKRMVTVMPANEFKAALRKLTDNQKREIASYMVEHGSTLSMERMDIMKQMSGIDVVRAIELKKANEEPAQKEG